MYISGQEEQRHEREEGTLEKSLRIDKGGARLETHVGQLLGSVSWLGGKVAKLVIDWKPGSRCL